MMLEEALRPGTAQADRPQILPAGGDGLLVRFALVAEPRAIAAAQSFHQRVTESDLPGLREVVPSLVSVLLRFDPEAVTRAEMAQRLETLLSEADWQSAAPHPAQRVWHLPVAFGGEHGPDLEEAAKLAGLSPQAAIDEITATPLSVLAIGFAPGQPYLGLLPEHWNLARRSELNPRVPKGALCVAVRQLVLFANASPTGWHQIAQTAFDVFRPDQSDPVPLHAGDEVRLAPVSGTEMDALLKAGDPMGGAHCEVRS